MRSEITLKEFSQKDMNKLSMRAPLVGFEKLDTATYLADIHNINKIMQK